jgi:hypothetical protein
MQASLSEIKATANLLYQAHLKTIGSSSPLNLLPLGQDISDELSVPAKLKYASGRGRRGYRADRVSERRA